MHELKSGLAVAGAGLGAAALVAAVGMSVGGGPAAASPLARRSLGATPAAHRIQARSTPTGSTGGSQKIGRCMAGNIEGSQASPDVGGHGPVLQDLHGYTPQKTSSSNMGPAANTGPGTGRLRPVGSPNWHPRPWSSHTSACPTASGGAGDAAAAPVRFQ